LKIEKLLYFCNSLTGRHNVWRDDAHWPSEPDRQLKFRTFKNPRWRTAAILENRKITISPQWCYRSARNLARWRTLALQTYWTANT